MNIIISNSSDMPIFLQIKNAIKESIYNGDLTEEEQLPSVRSLANDLKISFLTVKRAYDELEKEEKLKEIQDLIEKIYEISKISNITANDVKEIFKIIFEEDK